jgi:hypothetical protein
LTINKDTAYKKITNCTNVIAKKTLESIYSRLDSHGRIKLRGAQSPLKVTRE